MLTDVPGISDEWCWQMSQGNIRQQIRQNMKTKVDSGLEASYAATLCKKWRNYSFSLWRWWWYRGVSHRSLQGCTDLCKIALELEGVEHWINPPFKLLELPCKPSTNSLFFPAEWNQSNEKALHGPLDDQFFRARDHSTMTLLENGNRKKQDFDNKMPKSTCYSRDIIGVQESIAMLFQ